MKKLHYTQNMWAVVPQLFHEELHKYDRKLNFSLLNQGLGFYLHSNNKIIHMYNLILIAFLISKTHEKKK